MVVKAIPHPSDEGKWMSNFDDYGHGEGNGKSRGMIYKHYRKTHSNESDKIENTDDFVSTEWADAGSVPKAKKIKEPLKDMATGTVSQINLKAQSHIIRAGFIGLDRLVTHWGRGVTGNKEWEINRSDEDLDTLQDSTMQLLDYYEVSIPVTPPMIWAVTVGNAYAPPVMEVMKNRDPNRKKKGLIARIFRRKSKKAEPKKEDDENES